MLCEGENKMTDNGKPFLTYSEQVNRLVEKGIKCSKPNEKKALIRKGYFNLINGFKRPFVVNKTSNGDHEYIEGTSVEKIYKVSRFDRRVSNMLLKNITHVEEEVRTITSYKLDLICKKQDVDWTNVDAYDNHLDSRLIESLLDDIEFEIDKAKRNNNSYIRHYANKNGELPTWIMTKVIRFTTLITLIQYSKKELREYLSDLYSIGYNSRENDFRILVGALHWMRKTRNACAHNERIIFLEDNNKIVLTPYHRMLTNAYKDRTRNKQVVDLIIFLKYFNTKREFNKLINFFKNELKQIHEVVPNHVFEKIRASLGIRQVKHLDILKRSEKKINYLELL